MEQAKTAIKDFTSRSGHHDTTVHESVAPSVQHETVKPTRHENITSAVDKEIHQDHYHRTVQPVHDREVLPEKHTAKLGEVQHRQFDHRDHEGSKRALATEQGQFKDERVLHDTKHTQSTAPAVGSEHIHHHIHETIQPVVHKETIQPHVVHTTVPIHETHHHAAKHHTASTLPAVSMDEFKAKGGVLGGREERYDAFEGEPKKIGGVLSGHHGAKGHHDPASHHTSTKRDSHHAREEIPTNGALGKTEGDIHHSHKDGYIKPSSNTTHPHGTTQAPTQSHDPRNMASLGLKKEGGATTSSPTTTSPTHNNLNKTSSTGSGKASLLDRINPLKDSDGDGKKGFMK